MKRKASRHHGGSSKRFMRAGAGVAAAVIRGHAKRNWKKFAKKVVKRSNHKAAGKMPMAGAKVKMEHGKIKHDYAEEAGGVDKIWLDMALDNKKWIKNLMPKLGMWKFLHTFPWACTQSSGRVGYGYFNTHYTYQQFAGNALTTGKPWDWKSSLWDFNPNRGITGNSSGSTSAPSFLPSLIRNTIPNDDRILVEDCLSEVYFTNGYNAPVEIKCFWVTPRNNVATVGPAFTVDPLTDWQNRCFSENMGQPQGIQDKDAGGETQPAFGYPLPGDPGNTPTSYRTWNQSWRIIRKRDFILAPSAQKKVTYRITYHNVAELSRFSVNLQDYPGRSVYCFYLARGLLVKDKSGQAHSLGVGATGLTNILYTFAPVDVGTVTVNKWRFGALSQQVDYSTEFQQAIFQASGGQNTVTDEVVAAVVDA